MKKPGANPNRQLGQYRRMIRDQRRMMWVAVSLWMIPLLLFAAAFLFQWHWFAKTFLGIALVSGLIQHVWEVGRLRDYHEKEATLSSVAHAATEDRPDPGLR